MASEVGVNDSALDSVFSLLKKYGVRMFRHKTEHEYIEVVMGPDEIEQSDEETMEDKDISLYSNNSIGITRKSFDDEEEVDYFSVKKRVGR